MNGPRGVTHVARVAHYLGETHTGHASTRRNSFSTCTRSKGSQESHGSQDAQNWTLPFAEVTRRSPSLVTPRSAREVIL